MKNVVFPKMPAPTALVAFIAFFVAVLPSRADADWDSYSKFYSVVESFDSEFETPADIASFDFSNTALLILVASAVTHEERDILLREVENGLFLWILDEESFSADFFGAKLAPCYATNQKRLIGNNPALPVIDVHAKKSAYFREVEELVFNHPACVISAPDDGYALLGLNENSATNTLIFEKILGQGKILGIFDVSFIIDLSLASSGNEKFIRNVIASALSDRRDKIAIVSPYLKSKSPPILSDESKRIALFFFLCSLAILALIFFIPSFRANFLRIPRTTQNNSFL